MSKKELLRRKIGHIDLFRVKTIGDLVKAMDLSSYQSRNMARCFEVYKTMLEDDARVTVFLGLAGAMVPAGMRKILVDMLRKSVVDVIVSTGANLYHDICEALHVHHYIGTPNIDDSRLHTLAIDRVYDTFADEEGFRMVDEKIVEFTESMTVGEHSSRTYLAELGGIIEDENSILHSASECGIPVFCPALNDSSIGLALTKYYLQRRGRPMVSLNPIRDNYEIAQIRLRSRKTGVVFIGGGVPKNYIQQIGVLIKVADLGCEDLGHDYAVQITMDDPKWGGLSGATVEEAISWGKYSKGVKKAVVYVDATIGLPMIMGAVFELCGEQIEKRGRLCYKWNGPVLERIGNTPITTLKVEKKA